jgi:hypothetical protein
MMKGSASPSSISEAMVHEIDEERIEILAKRI